MSLCLGVSSLAFGQENQRVRIAPLPLKVATGDDRVDADLQRRFEVKLLSTKQVEAPLPGAVQAFLRDRTGAACEKDAACLKTLAENTRSIYSLAATLELNGRGDALETSATLFRIDGVKKEVFFTQPYNRDRTTLAAAGDAALTELINRLELAGVDRVLPERTEAPPLPPPVVVVQTTSTGRIVSYTAGAIGAAALVAGVGLLLSAELDAPRVTLDMNRFVTLEPTPDNQALLSGIQTKRTLGTALAIGGGAIALGAVILFFMSPPTDPTNSVSFVPNINVGPTVGGMAGSMTWRLP